MELISKDKFFNYCKDIYIFNNKRIAIEDILECDFFITDDFISNYVELLLSNLTGIKEFRGHPEEESNVIDIMFESFYDIICEKKELNEELLEDFYNTYYRLNDSFKKE